MTAQQQYEEALHVARKAERDGGPWPLQMLQEAADAGHPPALYALATWYLHGRAVRKNFKKAVALLKKASTANIPAAQYDLGVSYELGKGVAKSTKLAFRWYLRAARNGDPGGLTEVARCYYYGI